MVLQIHGGQGTELSEETGISLWKCDKEWYMAWQRQCYLSNNLFHFPPRHIAIFNFSAPLVSRWDHKTDF